MKGGAWYDADRIKYWGIMLTTLGAVFVAIYVLALWRGRRFFVLALAVAVPFNDSAVLAFGDVGVSPFYLGLVLYIAAALLGRRQSAPPRKLSRLPLALFLVGALVTAFGPGLFEGMSVIASGVGLDTQVASPSLLGYSLSNLAQVGYLGLALLFVHFNERDGYVTRRFLSIAFAVGVLTAMTVWAFPALQGVFDNFPGGFYAKSSSLRLRGQFSEPSHLGAFAVAAVMYFGTSLLQVRGGARLIGNAALFVLSCAALALSESGTAVAGILASCAVVALLGLVRFFRGARVARGPLIVGHLLAPVLLIFSPSIITFIGALVDDKQDTISYTNRGLSNSMAIDVFNQTYWLGAGLGSNRASSLLTMLLSQIGIVGVLLFVGILLTCYKRSISLRDRMPALLALIATVAAAFISYPDFASPVMWVLIAATFSRPRPVVDTGRGRALRLPLAGEQGFVEQVGVPSNGFHEQPAGLARVLD